MPRYLSARWASGALRGILPNESGPATAGLEPAGEASVRGAIEINIPDEGR